MKKHVWQVNVLGKSPILTILPTLTNFHALFCFIWWPSYFFSWPNRNFERPSVTYCIIKAKYVSHEFYRKASMICNMNQREACFAFWNRNFSFHIIKTSRFPWNLVSKKIDLKLSFNKWQFMHGTESGPSLHNSHYTCDDTLKSVTNFSQTCSFLFIDVFFFISSLAHAHLQHIYWFFFSFFYM